MSLPSMVTIESAMLIMDSSPSLKKLMIKHNINNYEIVIVLDKIQKYFSSCKSDEVIDGYTCIFNCLTKNFYNCGISNTSNLIMDLFKRELHIKAKKYNNILICDKESYDLEVKRMLKMCVYIFKYYDDPSKYNQTSSDAWTNATHNRNAYLIACLCIQNDLPAGDPCWMGKHISSFIKY